MRTTVLQVRASNVPKALLLCQEDTSRICKYLNEAIQRLMLAGGETGWFGSWMRVVFAVDPDDPYITLPREIARIINLTVCREPIRIRNEFYELIPDNLPGLMTPSDMAKTYLGTSAFERGTFPTMVDLTSTNQLLRVYYTDVRDVGKRILIKGKDQNGNPIYSTDSSMEINGFYLTLAAPFTTSTFQVSEITNIMKDATYGDVLLYQVDATTGALVLLSRYAPDEITPEYRRYYLDELPTSCGDGEDTVQVTAMAKLEYVPVSRDTDFLLIGNIPALKEECLSIRYDEMDDGGAKELSMVHHANAIKLLRDEMIHYLGRQNIAVFTNPFGTARLKYKRVGLIL